MQDHTKETLDDIELIVTYAVFKLNAKGKLKLDTESRINHEGIWDSERAFNPSGYKTKEEAIWAIKRYFADEYSTGEDFSIQEMYTYRS